MSWKNWFHRWGVVRKVGTPSSGWWGPPRGTHSLGSQGGKGGSGLMGKVAGSLSKEESKALSSVLARVPSEHAKYVKEVKFSNLEGYPPEVEGSSDWNTGKIEMRAAGREIPISHSVPHEIGHLVLMKSTGKPAWTETGRIYRETKEGNGKFPTEYAATNPYEFFAESYATFLNSPDTLKAANPQMYSVMEGEVFA
jgi:hypothetical protein